MRRLPSLLAEPSGRWLVPFAAAGLLLVSGLPGGNRPVRAAPSPQALLETEMPKKIKALQDRWKSRGVSYKGQRKNFDILKGRKLGIHHEFTYKRANGWYLQLTIDLRDTPGTRNTLGYGLNSKYCFEMIKSRHDKEWVLTKFVPTTPDFDPSKHGFFMKGDFRTHVDHAVDVTVLPTFNFGWIDPAKLSELPDFKLLAVTEGARPGLVQADFESAIHPPAGKRTVVNHLVFDRDLDWLPVEFRQVITVGAEQREISFARELTRAASGYRGRSTMVVRSLSHAKPVSHVEYVNEGEWAPADLPEADFTLSSFGLPEPPGVVWKKPVPKYVWALSVGVLLLLAFGVMRRWRRAWPWQAHPPEASNVAKAP